MTLRATTDLALSACCWACFLGLPFSLGASTASAEQGVSEFIANYCADCHRGDEPSGAVSLEPDNLSWSDNESLPLYERVMKVVRDRAMPPSDAEQPLPEAREQFTAALHERLLTESGLGGTVLRRLTRVEYENSIQQIFGIDFTTPEGFPTSLASHNFENNAQFLVMSAPLLEAYFQSAITVADQLLPPERQAVTSSQVSVTPTDMVISYSSGAIVDGTMRLAARTDQLWRSSTWPAKFEARAAGIYRLKVLASKFAPGSKAWPGPVESIQMRIVARSLHEKDGEAVSKQRVLGEFTVHSAAPADYELEVPLYPGETPVIYMPDGILDGDRDDRAELEATLRKMFVNDPRLLAGWLTVKHSNGLRGGLGWDRVKAIRDSDELDLAAIDMSPKAVDKLVKKMSSNPGLYVETVIFQLFEEGPALAVHAMEIEGPLRPVDDPQVLSNQRTANRFFGTDPTRWDGAETRRFLKRFLTSVFRRPATSDELDAYAALIDRQLEQQDSIEDALHLVIRTALMSPKFLFRAHHTELDQYDLAARLSFFLTSRPPDGPLLKAAATQQLSDSDSLAHHARRLLKSEHSESFIAEFTGDWLGTSHLDDIMPDTRLFPMFSEEHRTAMVAEAEMFFAEILSRDLPLNTFIQPDFTFANKALADDIYGIDGIKHSSLKRIQLPKNSPHGGLLGQAGVMMATANGVDTQPVERGVWVLRNVLGMPPPPPPENVPALTPDTRSAQTVRDMLQAHQSESSCATCHRKIDPLGLVLENFDPIGRWRTSYPVTRADESEHEQLESDNAIVPKGTLPDGTRLQHVNDLKEHVVQNSDLFVHCLSEKLLSYATGRQLSYAERCEIEEIVSEHADAQAGFQDLLIRLIQSRTFRTK